MTQDVDFYEGFDKYGPPDKAITIDDLGGEWTTIVDPFSGGQFTLTITDSLVAEGRALEMHAQTTGSTAVAQLFKSLPGTFARIMGALHFSADLNNRVGVLFLDNTTVQHALAIEPTTGRVSTRSGTLTAAMVAQSAESVSQNAAHCLQFELTFHNSAGIVKAWLDGSAISALTYSGVDTTQTANNYINGFALAAQAIFGTPTTVIWDHLKLWLWTASGGAETPPLTNPIVETQFPVEDVAVDFAFGAGILGSATRVVTTTNAPGANRLSLVQVTAEADSTLDSISIVPAATSAGAKFKGVVYADSGADAPAALLSSGTEVVGCTSGVQLDMPLVTPQAITSGDKYWVGYITDTSVAIRAMDDLAHGQGKANTYGSGAPDPAGSMTSALTTWLIWGNVSAVAVNWPQVNENPPVGELSYVVSDTVGALDLFNFNPLASTPTVIYGIAVKGNMRRTDGGARTMNLIHKSGATTGDGLNPGQTPATTYGWVASYYRVDPDTIAAFNESGLNAGQSGYEIAS